MKIIIVGGLSNSLLNFRGDLIREFVAKGGDVVAMSAVTDAAQKKQIESLGCRFISYPIERNGLNILSDLKTLFRLYKVFRLEQPDVILSYTIKPVIWGGIAARLCGKVYFYGLITGLGFAASPWEHHPLPLFC
mgnify:FL=1